MPKKEQKFICKNSKGADLHQGRAVDKRGVLTSCFVLICGNEDDISRKVLTRNYGALYPGRNT